MSPQAIAKAYLAALVAFLIADAIWIGVIAREFYQNQLGELLRDPPNLAAAGVFYLAYIAGVLYLVVRPALASGSLKSAALNGAILGLIAFGTYDMTNLATLEGWPVAVVVVDMIWGAVVTALVASAGYFAARPRN